jgi:hypothetical protein
VLEGHGDVITPHIIYNVTKTIQRQRKYKKNKISPP